MRIIILLGFSIILSGGGGVTLFHITSVQKVHPWNEFCKKKPSQVFAVAVMPANAVNNTGKPKPQYLDAYCVLQIGITNRLAVAPILEI